MVTPFMRIKLRIGYNGSLPVQVKNEQMTMPPKNRTSSNIRYSITAAIKRISILKDKRTLKLLGLFNFIAYPPNCFYKFRIAGRLSQFFAQPPNMCHDGIIVVKIFFSPYCFKQFFSRHYFSPAFAQIPKDIKFQGGQRYFRIKQGTGMRILIYNQSVNIVFLGLYGRIAFSMVVLGITPELRFNAGDEFQRIKGFGYIIVCP